MHLGSRVSALLDGRLPPDEEERAWAHVHECHPCRDLVEREGWVKTRLAGLSLADRMDCGAPDRLKDSLLASSTLSAGRTSLAGSPFSTAPTSARHRHRSLALIGGGAAGAAVVGVLALGAAGTPQLDRRAPSDLSRPTPSSNPTLDGRLDDRAPGDVQRLRRNQRGTAPHRTPALIEVVPPEVQQARMTP
jgi:hypothetical protein